jgi:hypothetical protein
MPIEDPASEGKCFGFRVRDYDVQWVVRTGGVYVTALLPAKTSGV